MESMLLRFCSSEEVPPIVVVQDPVNTSKIEKKERQRPYFFTYQKMFDKLHKLCKQLHVFVVFVYCVCFVQHSSVTNLDNEIVWGCAIGTRRSPTTRPKQKLAKYIFSLHSNKTFRSWIICFYC